MVDFRVQFSWTSVKMRLFDFKGIKIGDVDFSADPKQ